MTLDDFTADGRRYAAELHPGGGGQPALVEFRDVTAGSEVIRATWTQQGDQATVAVFGAPLSEAEETLLRAMTSRLLGEEQAG